MLKNIIALLAVAAIGTASLFVTPSAQAQAKYFDQAALTATSTSGAATINGVSGTVTTESLATAAQASYTFTLTNDQIGPNSVLAINVDKGTATTGGLVPAFITPNSSGGSAIIIFQNPGSAAVNGTVKIRFTVISPR